MLTFVDLADGEVVEVNHADPLVGGLERHGLPTVPVNVTLTGYDRSSKRELN